jgi:hypothetical protein
MKERLFLNRIARQNAHVAKRNLKHAAIVESDPANPVASRLNETAMAAGKTSNRSLGFALNQRLSRRRDMLVKHLLQRIEPRLIVENFQWHIECSGREF